VLRITFALVGCAVLVSVLILICYGETQAPHQTADRPSTAQHSIFREELRMDRYRLFDLPKPYSCASKHRNRCVTLVIMTLSAWQVNGNTTPVRASVQHLTLMLLARLARWAILADAPTTAQAQRTQKRRPKIRRFALQSALRHQKANQHASYEECDSMHMYVARKPALENRERTLILKGEMSFAIETSLAAAVDTIASRNWSLPPQ
jgi:hypothetical protein